MSLAVLANDMASRGRNGDSHLVHMTPGEVQALQVLAERNGGTLTINPETGLPEANFLKKILPMVAGFALGPAGFGLMSAGMAGLTVGGITTLATGSLSRGLMAGLGAYGGAGLGEALAGAGASSLTASGAPIAENVAGAYVPPIEQVNPSNFAMSGMDKVGAGFNAAATNPMEFAKANMKPLGALAMTALTKPETFTKMPETQSTGYIRQKRYDPYTQTYTDMEPIKASEWGDRSFSDAYRPAGMAGGGIVALAAGGTPLYESLTASSTPAQIAAAYGQYASMAGGDTQKVQESAVDYLTKLGISAPTIESAYSTFLNPAATSTAQPTASNVSAPAPVAGPAAGSAAYNQMVGNWVNQNPNATAADISSAISTWGLNQQDVANALRANNLSNAAIYSAFQPDVGVPTTPLGGFAGLASNIGNFVGNANASALTQAQKRAAAYSAMQAEGYTEDDIIRATGKTVAELFPDKKITDNKTGQTFIYGSGNEAGYNTQGGFNDLTNYTGTLPPGVSGSSGAGQVGGGTVVNPNGTITTSPRIPGIPVGGFTGMAELRNVYTDRGGSLGYTPYTPKTIEEFQAKFGNTGGSQQAYDYLAGKGASTLIPATATGELMKPYGESVMGTPALLSRKAVIFDPETRKYVPNPDYVPTTFDKATGANVAGLSVNQLAALKVPDAATLQTQVEAGTMTYEQIAAALGISVAEAERRFPKKKVESVATTPLDYSGYGGDGADAASAGNGSTSGVGGDGGAGPGEGQGTAAGVGDTIASGGLVPRRMALGGLGSLAGGGQAGYNLGGYSDGGRLLRGPGDGVSDSIPASIGDRQPARLADGEFVVPARIVSELGNGSTEAGARKLYAMMDRVQKARGKTTGKNRVAANSRADKYLPA